MHKKFISIIFVISILFIQLGVIQIARSAGEIVALFEDSEEFNINNPSNQSLSKAHSIGPIPDNSILFFNLFCEGDASNVGGTENVFGQETLLVTPTGGEANFDMTICEFCQCAGLEGEEFEACHTANESCVTVNKGRFVFDAIISTEILPDPDFPEADLVLFTMTDQESFSDCTGRFEEPCEQETLVLTHHCTHRINAMGDIVKSISSAYIFSTSN